MTPEPDFTLVFAPEVVEHIQVIDKKYHSLIRETITEQLSYTPLEVTRNRKPLEPPTPFGATWELRLGPNNRFRVFYDVNTAEQTVLVLAIGVKDRERLFIGTQEIEI